MSIHFLGIHLSILLLRSCCAYKVGTYVKCGIVYYLALGNSHLFNLNVFSPLNNANQLIRIRDNAKMN